MMQKKDVGFSLMELVIVMVILGVVAAASMKPMMQGLTTYTTSKDLSILDWQVNMALEEITRKARSIMRTASITTASASQFVFVDSTNTTQNYRLSAGNILENSAVLVGNATGLSFIYYTRTGVATTTISAIRFVQPTITVSLGGNVISYTTAINLQNIP